MYSYIIKSNGSHPCVYIILDKNTQDIIDVENNIDVHGGVTYTDDYMFGWDYAHFEDVLYIEPDKTVSWKNKQNKASKIQNYDKKFRLTKFIFKKYCKFGFSSRSMKLV